METASEDYEDHLSSRRPHSLGKQGEIYTRISPLFLVFLGIEKFYSSHWALYHQTPGGLDTMPSPDNTHQVFDIGMDALDRVSGSTPFTPLTAVLALLLLALLLAALWWDWKQSPSDRKFK